MAKKVITGGKTAKANKAKATKGAKGAKATKAPERGKKVTVKATSKRTGEVRKIQHMKVGELVESYREGKTKVVYHFSPVIGERYQIEDLRSEVLICKFFQVARKYRPVDSVGSMAIAMKRIKAGAYRKDQSTGLSRKLSERI
jgi:hypothetical protein